MRENEIAAVVVDACFKLHKTLGPGLLETVYETFLEHELTCRGLRVRRQVPQPVEFEGIRLHQGFRLDLLVEEAVIIEVKSVEDLAEVHFKQVLTYLRLSNLKLGILVNFNTSLIKDGIRRVVNNLGTSAE
jgi:GxxExxY protein